ncbi:unnamed protein product [Arabis nemorensis]|uniref:C2H2-type domain-containing protein n=1 Tax=Arabis nemorensis TaxID=586526 RepID=A0A565CH93_9BRAS|nr:unnamed protein product [Arabis nemorensis]
MEFWGKRFPDLLRLLRSVSRLNRNDALAGVEVKSGASLSVDPGEDMILHISQAALGKNESNENESVRLYLKVGNQKLVIGTLSHEKFPQMSTEIVLEKGFELSHSSENGSVYFTGYKVDAYESYPFNCVKQVNFQLPNEDVKANEEESDDDTSSDDSSDGSESEEVKVVTTEVENGEDAEDDSSDDAEDDSDEDDSSEEETPKKAEEPKKRSAEASTSKKAVSNKKAKFVTPQKTETKKPHVHVATPHPSKGGKNSGSKGESSKKQQTPKSAGTFGCKSCNRTFTSEGGLQSHTKAKHSAAA